MRRRAAAAASLILAALVVAGAVALIVTDFPRSLPAVVAVAAAALAAGDAMLHRGARRRAAAALTLVLLAAAVVFVIVNGRLLDIALLVIVAAASLAAARTAFAVRAHLPSAPVPAHPVLFWNARSGGGKATRFAVADEARARGIEPIELAPGLDLERLARDAVADGADALAMAGGDGSQAIVAMVAAEHGLPYACIPAGTRNHFALDLGVDREDVVGALDAFVDGGERRVDLARVNGRVFVNNVSLGLYADAVQRPEYRDAKLRTIARTMGEDRDTDVILVSNNPYRLGHGVGSGTRPRLDAGVLGVSLVGPGPSSEERRPWRQSSAPTFEFAADHPVNVGVDGEALVLDPPLRFATWPGALRVRVARAHPGASPSAAMPDREWDAARALAAIALGGRDGAVSRPDARPPSPVVSTPLSGSQEPQRLNSPPPPEALDGHRGTAGEDDALP